MKPINFAEAKTPLLENGLLLLNTDLVGIRYMSQLLGYGNTSIASKGGITLPTEIWKEIFALVEASNDDNYCFVRASVVSESPTKKLLCCVRNEFDLDLSQETLAGGLDDLKAVLDFEQYLESATPSTTEDISLELPELRQLSGSENTFSVILESSRLGPFPCLMAHVEVPDVVSRIDKGSCWACGGVRFICPGCGGVGQLFDVFMGCGVDLACPLCMGLNFAQNHRDFLKEFYWEDPPEVEDSAMERSIQRRLEELGYN